MRDRVAVLSTVRDLGSTGFVDVALSRAVEQNWFDGPKVIPVGTYITITGGHCDLTGFAPGILERGPESGVADGPQEVVKAVRYQIEHGARWIKVCATAGVFSFEGHAGAQQYTEEEIRAAVEEEETGVPRCFACSRQVAPGIAAPEIGPKSNRRVADLTPSTIRRRLGTARARSSPHPATRVSGPRLVSYPPPLTRRNTDRTFSAGGSSSMASNLFGARYVLEHESGRGGMATVYLATDRTHGRSVAVKVLHAELAAVLGPERFLHEIRVLATLHHPNILGLIDSGVMDDAGDALRGRPFFVMPYVAGESLRQRLERDGPLPIAEAVRIAEEVAGALDYAHRHGVIHRDIKPENILLHDGRALVVDFGIALAVSNAGRDRLTQTGISLGTPQYMAPEQASGETRADARADVYALGCVLYEMLTGEPPFTGPNAQAIVARVMTERPVEPITRRGTIPAHLEDAVLTALEKLPADRFGTAADFAAALTPHAPSSPRRHRSRVHSGSWILIVILGAVAAGASALAAWALLRPRDALSDATRRVYESHIVLPDSTPLAYIGAAPLGVGTPALAASPDGAFLVFVGQSGGTSRLYVRPLDGSTVTALPGTEGAYAPFFSPDGQSVGFFAGGVVKRTSVQGGATVSLAELILPYGGVWLGDGRIIVTALEGRQLVAVPSAGGTPVVVGSAELPLRIVFPQSLPGDSTVVASTIDSRLAVVSTMTARAELLGPNGPVSVDAVRPGELFSGTNPRFVASGHLLYHSLDGVVMALPFDPAARRALGPPVAVLSGVRLESIWGAGQLAVTRDGTLLYARGVNGRLNRLVWRKEAGLGDTLAAFGPADYGDMDLSPDGTRLVVRICTSQGTCAPHALRLRDGVQVSLPTPHPASVWVSGAVGWADRGERLFDRRSRSSEERSVATFFYSPESPAQSDSLSGILVRDIARDGAVLYERGDSLYVGPSVAEVSSSTPRPGFQLLERDAWGHQLRQGGDWVAYTARSDQAGEYVVYLARTTPPFDRWRASPRGGEEPLWSPAGDLVYREGNRWMRVSSPSVTGGRPGAATFMFSGPYLNVLGRSHDMAPDGRHLLIAGPTELTTTSLTIVTNWASRLPGAEGDGGRSTARR